MLHEANRYRGNRLRRSEIFQTPGYRDVKYKLLLSPADVSRDGAARHVVVLVFKPHLVYCEI